MIYIIGIGPGGNLDFLTLRANKVIEQNVDLGIYVGEMICNDIRDLFQNKTLITGNLSKDYVLEIINESISENKNLAILMPGDSSFYSGQYGEQFMLHEYVKLLKSKSCDYEIIPGITALNAICAKISIDITSFSTNQNVFITSIERIRDTKQYFPKQLKKVFATKPNIVLYQSFRDWLLVKDLLLSEGFNKNTRVVFAYKVSWIDQQIIDTTLMNIDKDIKGKDLSRHTIILILPKINHL